MEEHQKVQTAAGLLSVDALTWWAEYIKDQEIVESEMSWTKFKTLVTSRFTLEYANICAGVAWLDLRQTHSIKAYVVKFQGVVGTPQHVLDYNKQLRFIHRLQPWAHNLMFRMLQLPDNLHVAPLHNLSRNGRATTSRDTSVTNRDLDASRGATRG